MSGEKVLHRYCVQHPDDACVSCYSRQTAPTPVPSEGAETTAGEREECALCGYSGDDETGWTITATGPTVALVCPTCAGPYVSLIAYLRHSMPSGQAISDLHALLDRVRREEGERIAQAIERCRTKVLSAEHRDALDSAAHIARAASVGRGEGL